MRVELTLAEPQSAVPPQHFGPLVRLEGIEPSFSAYQADGLPLIYRRMERPMGFAAAARPNRQGGFEKICSIALRR